MRSNATEYHGVGAVVIWQPTHWGNFTLPGVARSGACLLSHRAGRGVPLGSEKHHQASPRRPVKQGQVLPVCQKTPSAKTLAMADDLQCSCRTTRGQNVRSCRLTGVTWCPCHVDRNMLWTVPTFTRPYPGTAGHRNCTRWAYWRPWNSSWNLMMNVRSLVLKPGTRLGFVMRLPQLAARALDACAQHPLTKLFQTEIVFGSRKLCGAAHWSPPWHR